MTGTAGRVNIDEERSAIRINGGAGRGGEHASRDGA